MSVGWIDSEKESFLSSVKGMMKMHAIGFTHLLIDIVSLTRLEKSLKVKKPKIEHSI